MARRALAGASARVLCPRFCITCTTTGTYNVDIISEIARTFPFPIPPSCLLSMAVLKLTIHVRNYINGVVTWSLSQQRGTK